MEGSADSASCAICGRTILAGERTHTYASRDGETHEVCALCRDDAESRGWVPPSEIEAAPAPPRRSRGRLTSIVRTLREGAATAARGAGEARTEREDGGETAAAAEPADPIATACAAFNDSRSRRTVAGLNRSLGPSRGCAVPTPDGDVRVTVAWDLSWYQWRVTPGGVISHAKGAEVDELAAADRDWNLEVAEDGALAPAGEGP